MTRCVNGEGRCVIRVAAPTEEVMCPPVFQYRDVVEVVFEERVELAAAESSAILLHPVPLPLAGCINSDGERACAE